uniref:t-SNARE domain-containing protein 1-like n=1 Tax=Pristiophorus japonicus TaxID=55135 RepID=UPI00398EDFFC
MSEKKTLRKVKDGQRLRTLWFTDEELDALVSAVEARYRHLTRDGHGKPPPASYQWIWKEIGEAMSAVGTIVRDGDQCRKRWNDIVAVVRKKLSTYASEQRRMGGGPPKVLEINDWEQHALALVGGHNYAISHGGADPLPQHVFCHLPHPERGATSC